MFLPDYLLFPFKNMAIPSQMCIYWCSLLFVMCGDQLIWSNLCVCGKAFTIEHSLSCSYNGFPQPLSDIMNTADLLSQVCLNEWVKPQLQPLSARFLVKLCHIIHPMHMIIPGWIYLPNDFGILLISGHLLMWEFSIPWLKVTSYNKSLSGCYHREWEEKSIW